MHRMRHSPAVVATDNAQRCFHTCFRATYHLAVSPNRGFLVGKPDSLGFAGETATPQPSTTDGTPPVRTLSELSAAHGVNSKVIGQWKQRLVKGATQVFGREFDR